VDHTDPDGRLLQITGSAPFRRVVHLQIVQLLKKPGGRELVLRLYNSKNVHRIVETDQKYSNRTVPSGPSRNGVGDGSVITFNPYSRDTLLPDDRGSYETDPYVQLGHELGHADAMDRGAQSTDMGPVKPGTTPPAERNAMRWENAIRAEHGLTLRSHYYPVAN
jgi:hypothetical protein